MNLAIAKPVVTLYLPRNDNLIGGNHLSKPIVRIIDDDAGIRDSLSGLVMSLGLAVKAYGSVQEFWSDGPTDDPGCIVADVRLPGRSGLDFQDDLAQGKFDLPIIFISGYADVPMTVRAMKGGAVEFLTKPLRHQDLVDAIHAAVERDRSSRTASKHLAKLRSAFGQLSAREREIMEWVISGRLNKQIAADVGISEATVKLHRSHVMQKMGASSLPELVRMADLLGLNPDRLNT